MATFFHGSEDHALRVAKNGKKPGTEFSFTALFFADSYEKAELYGPHVYELDVDTRKLFNTPKRGTPPLVRLSNAFHKECSAFGLPEEPEEARTFLAECAIWNEQLEEDDLPFLGYIFNCSPWLASAKMKRFRIRLARRLGGYIGATFPYGTIAVFEECLPAELRHATKEKKHA